jgi:GNAT superfamily N-acetyltransferase
MTRPRPHLRFLSSAYGWSHEFDRSFRTFHDRIFMPAFPDPDLREPARRLKQLSDPRHFGSREPWGFIQLALAPRGALEVPVGGILFELFRACDAALVTYIAVEKRHRRHGVARTLFDGMLEELHGQHRARANPLLIFAETEMMVENEGDAARLRALHRLGFGALDFRYVQPPLSPQKQHVEGLTLLVRGAGSVPFSAVPAARLAHFLRIFYRSILGDTLVNDERLMKVLAEVEARNMIAVTPLLDHK